MQVVARRRRAELGSGRRTAVFRLPRGRGRRQAGSRRPVQSTRPLRRSVLRQRTHRPLGRRPRRMGQ